MSFPLMLGDNAALTWACPHGGTFKVNASMSADDGKSVAITGDAVAPVAPCPVFLQVVYLHVLILLVQ